MNITRQKLAYHLQILTNYDIITNFYDKRQGVKDHSFYELSAFGRELLIGISIPKQDAELEQPGSNVEIEPDNEQLSRSANFRTISQIKYRPYEKYIIKHSPSKLKQIDPMMTGYIDPWLECKIQNPPDRSNLEIKISLPTQRQHYLSYKRPFRIIKIVNYRY